jgi:hypothetical protein
VSDVTIWLDEDEFWPWRSIVDEPRDNLKKYSTAVVVDEATAERWRSGLAAAEALQEEISTAWNRAKATTDD